MTQSRKVQTMFSIGVALACTAATYAAWLGYSGSTSNFTLAFGTAVVCGFLVFVTCESMVMMLPRLDMTGRVISGGFALVLMVLTFFFSTTWGVMALGGKTAMSAHLQATVDGADNTALKIYRQVVKEKNMAPQLRDLARQYESLATRETVGALSGLRGEGDVVSTLRSTSNVFEGAATTIDKVSGEADELYAEYQKLSDNGRKLMADIQGTDITNGARVRELLTGFGNNLSNINRVIVRLRNTSAREYVQTVSKNLGQLNLSPQDNSRPEQKTAIERLTPAVRAAQKVVDQITATDQLDSDTNQTFSMMEPSEAIWVYAGRIRMQWGAAIAIDLVPFFLAFLTLAFLKVFKEDLEKEEDARAEALAAAKESRPRVADIHSVSGGTSRT